MYLKYVFNFQKGKIEHLQLGRWLRARYQKFLPKTYSEKDIYVRSTDVDRTLMSAEANLAGLYPPVKKQIWDDNIKWQPIPIHTKPEHDDALLAAKKNCPKYAMLTNQLFKNKYFRNVSHQNHDLYAYLTRYSGDTINSLESLEFLYNTLMVETFYNYTLPNWTLNVFPQKMQPWAFLSFATQAYTPELARLKVGPLFNYIISFFKNHTTKASDLPKLLIFSAHDTTIANVLNTMGAFDYHSPPYTATILFELKRRPNGRNYVNLFYKNSSEPRQISLRNCDFDCDLAEFITILKPVTVDLDQWAVECRLKWTHEWPLDLEGDVILICILVGVILLSTAVLVGLKKGRKESEANYIQLPNEEYS